MLRLLVASLVLFGGTALASPPPPPLPGLSGPLSLGPYFEVLIDRDAKLSFEEVRSSRWDAEFQRHTGEVLNLGYTSSALWLRFRLPREQLPAEGLLLEIRWPLLDHIEFYVPQPGDREGLRYRQLVVGDTLPWHVREVKDRNFVFRLLPSATPGEESFYLRVTTDGTITVPAYLWRSDVFASYSRTSQIGFGMFYGLLLALILYNLMLFISLRDIAYLYYVLYAVAFAIGLVCFDGFGFEYFGPDGQWWPNNGFATFSSLAALFAMQFVRAFLGTAASAPYSDRVLQVVVGISGFLAFCGATGWLLSYRYVTTSMTMIMLFTPALVAFIGIRAMLGGYRVARFLLLAWVFLLAGFVISSLRTFGVLPYTFYTLHSIHVGIATDLLLLSFALADRINFMRREARLEKAKAQAMEIASRHKSELLLRVLPEAVIPRLQAGESPIADQFADVTVVFADIIGFTPLSERLGPKRMVLLLNDLFGRFDLAASRLGVEKIETTGDGYLAVGGAPRPLDNHPEAVAEFALAIVGAASEVPVSETEHVQIRVGIHTGPVFAGVVGESRFHYKIFGETVNTASRIQGHAGSGRILISESTFKRVQSKFNIRKHDVVELKGHGPMQTYWLLSRSTS